MAEGPIAITGIGLVTPLGREPRAVVARISAEESAFVPAPLSGRYSCELFAAVRDFQPEEAVADEKSLRLMSRPALFSAAAARSALADAGLIVGRDYESEDIALYGATGTAGMTLSEAAPLLLHSADADGAFDIRRFGEAALKRVRPVLSFKILSNMPMCFVSIFESIQGPNAVYSPWEGHGAQAIVAGMEAILWGDAECALVGGCDTKANDFAYREMEETGVFGSWKRGAGLVPGEGAAFLVLETEARAAERGAKVWARVAASNTASRRLAEESRAQYDRVLAPLALGDVCAVVSSATGDADADGAEMEALAGAGLDAESVVAPKRFLGDTFAAAAAVQMALGACITSQRPAGTNTLVTCFGYGSEKAAFMLEGA